MKFFKASEGKEKIKDTIIKMIDEMHLESEDIVYFHVDRKSDFDELIKELERSTLNCIE